MKRINVFAAAIFIVMLAGTSAYAIRMDESSSSAQIKNITSGKIYDDFGNALEEIQSGDTLSIGPGDVYMSEAVYVYEKSNIIITGAGRDKSRILMANPSSVVLSFGGGKNVTIKNLYITHDVPPEEGCSQGVIEAYDIENITIENNELVGSGLLGISMWSASGRVSIVNNIIRDNQTYGINLNGDTEKIISEFVLKDNVIKDNDAYGMYCEWGCEAFGNVRVSAGNNDIVGNAAGDIDGLPSDFQKAIRDSMGSSVGKPTPPSGRAGGSQTTPRGSNGGGDQASTLARQYDVDEITLRELIKENDRITVLKEYKDSPETLAVKLKHLAYVNKYRRENGSGDISLDIAISRLCNYHSYDQVYNDYMAHNSLDGSSPWERADRYGITIWAENIAMPGDVSSCGDFDADASLKLMNYSTDMFMDEGPGGGHHDNMLNTAHSAMGFGLMCYDGRVRYTEEFR